MSLNKAVLIGYVGKDPEVRAFKDGSIANFSLATSERGYTLANGTEVPERSEWHSIVAKGRNAEFVEKWVKKGSALYIEGKIRTRSYDVQDGSKRFVVEIHAEKVEFFNIGGKKDEKEQRQKPAESPTKKDLFPAPGGSEDDLPF